MEAAPTVRRPWRSTGAVLAGFVTVFILSLATDQILHVLKIYPPWGEIMSDRLFALATSYRVVYTVLGGYITARLAPYRPLRHALLLGYIGLALSIVGAAATWNHVPPLGPHWYSLAIVATSLPCTWVGGKLAVAQPAGPSQPNLKT